MRHLISIMVIMGCGLGFGQEKPQLQALQQAKAEQKPVLYHFAPNYTHAEMQRKRAIADLRVHLDTLDISERKRRRYLKKLYSTEGLQELRQELEQDTLDN